MPYQAGAWFQGEVDHSGTRTPLRIETLGGIVVPLSAGERASLCRTLRPPVRAGRGAAGRRGAGPSLAERARDLIEVDQRFGPSGAGTFAGLAAAAPAGIDAARAFDPDRMARKARQAAAYVEETVELAWTLATEVPDLVGWFPAIALAFLDGVPDGLAGASDVAPGLAKRIAEVRGSVTSTALFSVGMSAGVTVGAVGHVVDIVGQLGAIVADPKALLEQLTGLVDALTGPDGERIARAMGHDLVEGALKDVARASQKDDIGFGMAVGELVAPFVLDVVLTLIGGGAVTVGSRALRALGRRSRLLRLIEGGGAGRLGRIVRSATPAARRQRRDRRGTSATAAGTGGDRGTQRAAAGDRGATGETRGTRSAAAAMGTGPADRGTDATGTGSTATRDRRDTDSTATGRPLVGADRAIARLRSRHGRLLADDDETNRELRRTLESTRGGRADLQRRADAAELAILDQVLVRRGAALTGAGGRGQVRALVRRSAPGSKTPDFEFDLSGRPNLYMEVTTPTLARQGRRSARATDPPDPTRRRMTGTELQADKTARTTQRASPAPSAGSWRAGPAARSARSVPA